MSTFLVSKRLAAFAAGITAWEAVVHLSLLVNRERPKLFGVRLTDRLNALQSIVPAIFAIALGSYAFSRRTSR